jgi:hypothetical protein
MNEAAHDYYPRRHEWRNHCELVSSTLQTKIGFGQPCLDYNLDKPISNIKHCSILISNYSVLTVLMIEVEGIKVALIKSFMWDLPLFNNSHWQAPYLTC